MSYAKVKEEGRGLTFEHNYSTAIHNGEEEKEGGGEGGGANPTNRNHGS
jgi:hypothetical protein